MNNLGEFLLDLLDNGLLVCAPFLAAASIWVLVNWPLWWLLAAVTLFCATLVCYGFLMLLGFIIEHGHREEFEALIGHKMELPNELKAFGAVHLYSAGYPLDYLLNATVMWLPLFRVPMEHTVTEALNKYSTKDGWRGRVARYFGRFWINPLDLKSLAHGKQHIDIGENHGS